MDKENFFKGKLGFGGAFSDALSRATPIVIDTFEDHGHDVHAFAARNSASIRMELDQFTVELRHRPQMKRGWKAPQWAGDTLELRLTPLFPEFCDQEITEMLLAAVLFNLANDLNPISIKWLNTPVLLSRDEFLSAFEPVDLNNLESAPDAQVPEALVPAFEMPLAEADDFAYWHGGTSVALLEPAVQRDPMPLDRFLVAADSANAQISQTDTRPRGRSVFDPVDITARALDHHIDEILADDVEPGLVPDAVASLQHPPQTKPGVLKRIARPFVKAAETVHLLRTTELRYSFQILLLTALVLYLDSAGMVRAAINLLH